MPAVDKLKKLATGSAAIMASRLAGAGVGFLTQFLLVRMMGAHDLGVFYAASSLAAVLGVIVAQGYPQIAARFVGRYRNKQDAGLTGYFTGHAMREGLMAAFAAAIGVTVWSLAWPGMDSTERVAYGIAGWMLLSIATLNIMTNIAGGMREFVLCYMPEGLIRPILFFIVICVAGIVGFGLSAVSAMFIFALITTGLAYAVSIQLRRKMPDMRWRPASQSGVAWRWRREAWQLVLLAVFTNFFADVGILVAVPFLSKPDLAIFGLCLKLALLVGYFVQIGQQMVVPDMADARHSGDTDKLTRAAWRSIIVPSVMSIAATALIYAFGSELLAFFGPEFAAGRQTLLILLAAQLLRALAGPGVHLLTLSGVQRINMGVAVTSLAVLFGASAILCPRYGIEGAAFAVLIVYAYWTGISALALRHLKEPAVDIVWLTLRRFRGSMARAG